MHFIHCRGLAAGSVMPAKKASGMGGGSYRRIPLYLQRTGPYPQNILANMQLTGKPASFLPAKTLGAYNQSGRVMARAAAEHTTSFPQSEHGCHVQSSLNLDKGNLVMVYPYHLLCGSVLEIGWYKCSSVRARGTIILPNYKHCV